MPNAMPQKPPLLADAWGDQVENSIKGAGGRGYEDRECLRIANCTQKEADYTALIVTAGLDDR